MKKVTEPGHERREAAAERSHFVDSLGTRKFHRSFAMAVHLPRQGDQRHRELASEHASDGSAQGRHRRADKQQREQRVWLEVVDVENPVAIDDRIKRIAAAHDRDDTQHRAVVRPAVRARPVRGRPGRKVR